MNCRVAARTMGPVRNQIYSAVCAHLGALSFGYMIGYSSPALPQMIAAERILFNNDAAASWFGSIVTIGAILGCLVAGWLVQHRGRRASIIFSSVPFFAGWLLIYQTQLIWVLCAGRFLTGIGSGIILVSAPLYVAEVSSKEMRGMLGSGIQLSVTVGILLVYALGLVLDWRNLALCALVIPIIAVVVTLRAPESPRFLLDVGRRPEAVSTLTWLRGSSANAEEECRDMEETQAASASQATLVEILKRPEMFRPLGLAVVIMIFQQLSGINVVLFYSVSIFEAAGFKLYSGNATVMIGAVQVAGTAIACATMDRFGRRILLIAAGLGMSASCIALGIYYRISTRASTDINDLSWLALVSLICYVLAFSLGWGPIPMLVMSEIFPARARGTASTVASITNWVFAFIVTKSFASLQNGVGLDGTFLIFAGFCLLSVFFVRTFMPETKGKSLEDIELCFIGQAPLLA